MILFPTLQQLPMLLSVCVPIISVDVPGEWFTKILMVLDFETNRPIILLGRFGK